MKSEKNNQSKKERRIDLLDLLPPLKWLLKRRWFQFAVILPSLLIFILFIIAGLWGSPVGNANIIIIFVWILWWFLLISVMVPFFSRIWCTVCPFPFFGEWIQRGTLTGSRAANQCDTCHEDSKLRYKAGGNEYFGLGKKWPAQFKNIWLQNIGFLLLCTFSVLFLTRALVSVIVLGSLFLIATVMGFIFRKRVFCMYVCPVSGFQSLYAMTSKLSLRAKDVEVCNRIKKGEEFDFSEGIAACRSACPAGVDSSSYIALIASGDYKRAHEIIMQSMPLPGVCGRICTHPCESDCIRKSIDEPVSICSLKRFVADKVSDEDLQLSRKTGPVKDEKVAVIGSGPAGLSCAYYLALKSYKPVIYESQLLAGGMLRLIPDYRLPKEVLDREIECIKRAGVGILTNKTVGKDITFEQLKDEYDAVFVATGALLSRSLEVEGEDLSGVYEAIDFLRRVSLGKNIDVGKKTVIIGGGNTAVDSARAALREGAENVTVVYRRSREEMPAISQEVAAAEKEGIKFKFLTSPLKIKGISGKVNSLTCTKMKLGEPDESGRRRPLPVENSEHSIVADTVIVAVGQLPDTGFLSDEMNNEQGWLNVNSQTASTDLPGVFAGGDAVAGGDVFINAVAAGKKAALNIERYLKGQELEVVRLHPSAKKVEVEDLPIGVIHKEKKILSQHLSPGMRVNNFNEIESTLTEEEALDEAHRCLNCGICGECYRGSEKGWGCPWFQRTGAMERNNYCGLCMECVKTCPYDNIGLYERSFLSDKEIKGYDEAWKAFIMLGLAVAYSFVYLGPWGFLKNMANVTESGQWGHFFGYGVSLWAMALVLIPGAHGLAVWAGRKLSNVEGVSFKKSFIALSYTFVPFGLFIWIAFSFPLMFINGSYILTTLSDPLGWGWNLFGTAGIEWAPLLPQWMPLVQLLLIAAGLIFTLKVGWHNAMKIYKDKTEALKGFFPLTVLFGILAILFLRLYAG